MPSEHTIATLNEKVDLLHATQQEALDKAFAASQLAIIHAQEETDAKIAFLSTNQGDAIKWVLGVIALIIAALLGHFGK